MSTLTRQDLELKTAQHELANAEFQLKTTKDDVEIQKFYRENDRMSQQQEIIRRGIETITLVLKTGAPMLLQQHSHGGPKDVVSLVTEANKTLANKKLETFLNALEVPKFK